MPQGHSSLTADMKNIETTPNQTLMDIAVKHYGNAEAVGKLLADNPDLRNDPAALIAMGIDPLSAKAFFIDVALAAGQCVAVDTDSPLLRQSVTRELRGREINTFDL